MKNFLLINGPLFLAAALIFFRCRSSKIPRSAEMLVELFQGLERQKWKKISEQTGFSEQNRVSGMKTQ